MRSYCDTNCMLVQPLVKNPWAMKKSAEAKEPSFMSSQTDYPSKHLNFLSVFTRMRTCDRMLDGSLDNGKTTTVNLMHGKEIKVSGTNLPTYNGVYIGALMAALKDWSPESGLVLPADAGEVMEKMDREMPRYVNELTPTEC